MEGKPSADREAQASDSTVKGKENRWITFPFIIGTMACMTLAHSGWILNLIVYLIQVFNVKSITASQISNVVYGATCIFPIAGAVVADSFLGTFTVITISSFISLLALVLLALTAALPSFRPEHCESGSSFCRPPTKVQYGVLYLAITLACVGLGGTRFTMATMGANQFDKPKAQGIFFNWYFFTLYAASVIAATAIVYVENSVSWALGYGVSAGANFVGLAIFLLGYRYYRLDKPLGSPYTSLARVTVATIRKWKLKLSSSTEDYYHGQDGVTKAAAAPPQKSFRFLNRAALKIEGDINSDGSVAKPWRLCTVEEVENFKTLIRIFPLWSTTILLSTPIAVQNSLTVLQALTMDRHLGPHFKMPAGSLIVIVMLTTSISIALIDRLIWPLWKKVTGHFPSPLRRIGVGHVFNILSMVVSSLVEMKRLKVVRAHHLQNQPDAVVPMLALWLIPQLVLVGIGEAFHFPGQVDLYYKEFPLSLKSTATSMISVVIGVAYYMSTALVDVVQRVSNWLPDNLNSGRLDNVYWLISLMGVVNYCYFLVCAKLYRYQSVDNKV